MSFAGDTISIPIELDGDRLWHDGHPTRRNIRRDAERPPPTLRPTTRCCSRLAHARSIAGAKFNIHRTPMGLRADIAVGGNKNLVEARSISPQLTNGEEVGLDSVEVKSLANDL